MIAKVPVDDEIKELQKQLQILRAEKFRIETELETSNEESRLLKDTIKSLNSVNAQLKKEIQGYNKALHRPRLSPENLTELLRDAMKKMEGSLKTPGGRVNYTLDRFDSELKVNLLIDSESKLSIRLPDVGELVDPASLSIITLALKPIPMVPPGLIEVPLLIGISRDTALKELQEFDLKATIIEQPKKNNLEKVIDQSPEAYTEVTPGSTVTLIVAVLEKLSAPNVINMERDLAVRLLKKSGFVIGNIEYEISSTETGTVLRQSLLPGESAERGSPIDLVISEQESKKEEKLTGALKPRRVKKAG